MAGLRRVAPEKMTLPNVLACNAQSIFNSLAKYKMNRNLCAVAVTETWLNAEIDSTLITPPGFLCFGTDRVCKSNKRGGGTAIFINQGWCSSPKQSFTYAKDNIEATAVTFRIKLSCKFLSFIICSMALGNCIQWCPDISPGPVLPDNGTIRGVGHKTVLLPLRRIWLK